MTYKIIKNSSSDNESGIEPVKLLLDKSLQIMRLNENHGKL